MALSVHLATMIEMFAVILLLGCVYAARHTTQGLSYAHLRACRVDGLNDTPVPTSIVRDDDAFNTAYVYMILPP
jgi:hypothetical protein